MLDTPVILIRLLITGACGFVLYKYWKKLNVFVKALLILAVIAYGIPSLIAVLFSAF